MKDKFDIRCLCRIVPVNSENGTVFFFMPLSHFKETLECDTAIDIRNSDMYMFVNGKWKFQHNLKM